MRSPADWPTYDIRQLPHPVLRDWYNVQTHDRMVAHRNLMEVSENVRTVRDAQAVVDSYEIYAFQVDAWFYVQGALRESIARIR